MRQIFVHCHPNYKKFDVFFITNKIQKRTDTNINIIQGTDAIIFDNNRQDHCIIKQSNTKNNCTIENRRQKNGLRY